MRIVSVWLPRWPVLRFLAAQAENPSCEPVDPERPFVLAVDVPGGPRIAALNEAAEAEGLAAQDLLADARARADMLQVRAAEPAADDAALRRLALWATRYTPNVSLWGEENGADGLFLDVTGAAHLFGGEETLIGDLSRRLKRCGLPARIAVADTAGAAWALSRFHPAPLIALPGGKEGKALAPLPIEALRLSPETRTTLRRLGFKHVGGLIDKPRAPFAARFEGELLKRLDQALGRAPELLALVVPPPLYYSMRHLQEPVVTAEAIVGLAARLMSDIVPALQRDGVGAKTLRLALYRVDRDVTTIDIGLTMPTQDVRHVARLLDLKLERAADRMDAGLGFETISLAVTKAERIEARQTELVSTVDGMSDPEQEAALIDRLRQRIGPRSVRRVTPFASHLPERTEMLSVTGDDAIAWPEPDQARPRPLVLLSPAEMVEVTALVPEGPPLLFRWRGVVHTVGHAEGPERIASEWWRERGRATRDYYLVEDKAGRRFWIYREGLYGRETASPRWFMQGLFA